MTLLRVDAGGVEHLRERLIDHPATDAPIPQLEEVADHERGRDTAGAPGRVPQHLRDDDPRGLPIPLRDEIAVGEYLEQLHRRLLEPRVAGVVPGQTEQSVVL